MKYFNVEIITYADRSNHAHKIFRNIWANSKEEAEEIIKSESFAFGYKSIVVTDAND